MLWEVGSMAGGNLTVPAFMSEEPVAPPTVVHKHHNDQGNTEETTQTPEFTPCHNAEAA